MNGKMKAIAAAVFGIVPKVRPLTSGKIHIILEATDSGFPSLTRYRRIVISAPKPWEPLSQAACRAAS